MPLMIVQERELWSTIRNKINTNTDEIESRLQAVEVISYIRDGIGAPSDTDYNANDYYIDQQNWDLYRKVGAGWVFKTNLIGPAGVINRGVWSNAFSYQKNDAVAYRSSYWLALRNNIGIEPTVTNSSDWMPMARGTHEAGEWVSGTPYRTNDNVRYLGSTYRVIVDHTSVTVPNMTNSQYVLQVAKGDVGVQTRGDWLNTTAYVFRDIVRYRGSAWIALRANTGVEPTEASTLDWQLLVRGLNNLNAWSAATAYRRDDIVRYNASTWLALRSNTNVEPTDTNTLDWQVIARGFNNLNAWSNATAYKRDDVVTYRGSTWLSLRNNTNVEPTTGNISDWTRTVTGFNPMGTWSSGTIYRTNDIVNHIGSVYRVITNHTSTVTTPPNDATNYMLHVSKGDKGDTGNAGIVNQIQDKGINVAQRGILNFSGNVIITDDTINEKTNINIDKKTYAFYAESDVANSIPNNTNVKLGLVSKHLAIGTWDDPNDAWIAPRDIDVEIGGMLFVTGQADGTNIVWGILINGVASAYIAGAHSGSSRVLLAHGAKPFRLVSGDRIQMYGAHFGTTVTVNSATYFYIMEI